MSRTGSAVEELSRTWWKRNWKWAVPLASLALLGVRGCVKDLSTMSDKTPLVLLGVVLAVVGPIIYFGYRWDKKRTERLRQVCKVLGFTFEEGPVQNLGARFGEFQCFTPPVTGFNHGHNLMTGSLAEHPVTVMDHSYGGGGRKRADTRETLAVFPAGAKGLPDFELSPGGGRVLDKISAVLGVQDINFPENEAFSNHYVLRGTDEEAIRQAFSATTLAFFAANQGWSVQAHRGALTIYRSWKLYAPAKVPGFLAEALTVLGAFDSRVSPSETPPSALARTPTRPAVRALTQARGMTRQRKLSVLAVTALSLYGAMCYSLMTEVDTLRCDRTTEVCTVIHGKAYSSNVQEFPLHALTGAELRLSRVNPRGGNRSATVVLLTEDGPIPFMTYSSGLGTSEMERQVTEVNRFLATPSMQRLQLRRDNRVISSLVAAFPALLCAGMFLLVTGLGRAQKKRIQEQRHVCDVLGFTLEEGPVRELGARFGVFPWLSREGGIHEGRGLMTGSQAGHPVTVMDHSYGSIRETLAVFPEGAKELPDFELLPRGRRWGSWVLDESYLDIIFPENEEFSRHYELRGTDEAAVRRAFGATTLAFFAANQGRYVETRGGAMTIYRLATRCAPAELPGFLADALTVLGAFK